MSMGTKAAVVMSENEPLPDAVVTGCRVTASMTEIVMTGTNNVGHGPGLSTVVAAGLL